MSIDNVSLNDSNPWRLLLNLVTAERLSTDQASGAAKAEEIAQAKLSL